MGRRKAHCTRGFTARRFARTDAAKAVEIADGDTVTVLDTFAAQQKTRLSGIDAPEEPQP